MDERKIKERNRLKVIFSGRIGACYSHLFIMKLNGFHLMFKANMYLITFLKKLVKLHKICFYLVMYLVGVCAASPADSLEQFMIL